MDLNWWIDTAKWKHLSCGGGWMSPKILSLQWLLAEGQTREVYDMSITVDYLEMALEAWACIWGMTAIHKIVKSTEPSQNIVLHFTEHVKYVKCDTRQLAQIIYLLFVNFLEKLINQELERSITRRFSLRCRIIHYL
jgi:hypothetical protein